MSTQDINIRLRLTDEFTPAMQKVQAGIQKVGLSLEDAGRTMRKVGSEVSRLGTSFMMLGTTITAPLALAYSTLSQHSAIASAQVNKLKNTFIDIQIVIAQALTPIVEKLNNGLKGVYNWLNSLNPATREHVVQMVAMAGVWALVSGIVMKFAGGIVIAAANITLLIGQFLVAATSASIMGVSLGAAYLPIVAIIAGIGTLIFAMLKWKAVGDFVMNYWQIAWDTLLIAVNAFKLGIATVFDGFIKSIAFVVGALEKLPTPWKKNLAECRVFLDEWSSGVESDMGKTANTITSKSLAIGSILSGQNGSWATGLNTLKTNFADATLSIKGLYDSLMGGLSGKKGSGTEGSQRNFFTGFHVGLQNTINELGNWEKMGIDTATKMAQGMQQSFSNFFFDAFVGQLKTAQDYLIAFGQTAIRVISDVIAQIITLQIVKSVMAIGSSGTSTAVEGFGTIIEQSGLMHTGGAVKRAHSGAMLSGDEVPIIAQAGEGIISRRGMNRLGKGNFDSINRGDGGAKNGGITFVTPIVIQAWDAQDVSRNHKIIVSKIAEGIRNNSEIRKTIQSYCH